MFGFKNWKDFSESFFGTWYKEVTFFVSLMLGGIYFGITSVLAHINEFWYAPASAILFTMAIIVVDWAIAVYGAVLREEFETKKAKRLIPMVIANFVLLSIFYNMVKFLIEPIDIVLLTQGAELLVKIAAMYLGGVHFISALKNAAKAKLVNNKWVDFVMSKIDKHKDKLDELI